MIINKVTSRVYEVVPSYQNGLFIKCKEGRQKWLLTELKVI